MATFLAQLFGFGLLVWFVAKYAGPPIRTLMAAQRETVQNQLDASAVAAERLAAADSFHAARVEEILSPDPAAVLQALCDGRALPPTPRVPRELPNWRLKAVLSRLGLLASANAAFDALPQSQRDIALLAWNGDARCARNSQSVAFIASAIGLDSDAVDRIFKDAERLEI